MLQKQNSGGKENKFKPIHGRNLNDADGSVLMMSKSRLCKSV